MQPGKIVFEGKTEKGVPILIRYPKASDIGALLKYINILSLERTYIRYQGEQLTLEEEKKFVTGLLMRIKEKKDIQLQAYSKNKLIGITHVTLKAKNEKHVGIFGISVAKEFRNKGVGHLLTEKVIEEAKNNLPGLKIITLEVYENNEIGKKLYKEFGFKKYGSLPKGISWRGKFIDQNLMYKEI